MNLVSSAPHINRRTFLALSGLGLTSLLASCNGSSAPTTAVTPTVHPTLTEADWSKLASSLHGSLIRSNTPRYAAAQKLFNTRFDSILPLGIAYCTSPADVQSCLAFVRRFHLPITMRSGGHSYAGYSTTTGLIVDVTPMNQVMVDTDNGTATVGGGAHLIDVYSALAPHGVMIPAGSCATVGIAGLTLGGGVGVLGRKFGLTCDNLLSAQVVLANGDLLTCDQHTHADLFWALRGGGGGNFGVVTSFTFGVHPVSQLSLFTLNWPWTHAADVVDAWQHWGPQNPDELWSNCLLLGTENKQFTPSIRVTGVYIGTSSALQPFLQQLISQVGIPPTTSYVSTDPLLETMLIEAGCSSESVAACHLPSQNPQGRLSRDTSKAKSDYITNLLPRSAINVLVNAIAARQSSGTLSNGGIGMDAYGGALNRVAADATAFVHRDSLFSIQYTASWNASDPASVVTANETWLQQTWQAMRPYASGSAYQNYIDPDLTNWQQAYYGTNLLRLQQVKKAYDSNNLFHFAQSIAPM